jgi:hypothetical protein
MSPQAYQQNERENSETPQNSQLNHMACGIKPAGVRISDADKINNYHDGKNSGAKSSRKGESEARPFVHRMVPTSAAAHVTISIRRRRRSTEPRDVGSNYR